MDSANINSGRKWLLCFIDNYTEFYEKRGDKRVRYKTNVQNMDLSRNPETESSSHFPLLPENQQKEQYALDSRLGGF